MMIVEDFARATGFASCAAIPVESDPASVMRRIHAGEANEPCIFRGFASNWPAIRLWEEQYLLDHCGDVRVHPCVGLPQHGVPYLVESDDVRRTMSFKEFWHGHLAKTHCYLDSSPLEKFGSIASDLRMTDLLGDRKASATNLWLGRGTKSGLHFDGKDNFLIMIRGTKLATLAAPREAKRLYPFLDASVKSQVDVEAPDFARFPNASHVELKIAKLHPGDVLYIPINWWHYLSSPMDDYSISVNCWFGRSNTLRTDFRRMWNLGPRYLTKAAHDFFVHGLLGRPYFQRSHSPRPEGVELYHIVREELRRRLRRAQ
jgi:lysine-specific demethylase 8